MLSQIVLVLIGAIGTALVGGAAYLIRRRIEGTAASSMLDRRTKVLTLHKTLKEAGLSVEDVDAFDAELTRRIAKGAKEDEVAAELAQMAGPGFGESQAEMNILAGAELNIARAVMNKALEELKMSNCNTELADQSQRAWTRFAEKEARLKASVVEGGSMYPLVYAAELERLTIARIADVREHTEYLRSILVPPGQEG